MEKIMKVDEEFFDLKIFVCVQNKKMSILEVYQKFQK